MKGFTLLETMIYMTVSTMLVTSLISFSMMMLETNARATQALQTELDGITIMRTLETKTRLHLPITETIPGLAIISTSSLSTIAFPLNGQTFTFSLYEK